jgi:hypothetical protein
MDGGSADVAGAFTCPTGESVVLTGELIVLTGDIQNAYVFTVMLLTIIRICD